MTDNVTVTQLAALVAQATGFARKDVLEIVKNTFETIGDCLENGSPVTITGFGKIVVKDNPSRMVRNPATGEQVMSKPSRKLRYTAASTLKKRLLPPQ